MSTALADILASIPAVGVDLAELTHLANQMFEAQDLVVDDGRANNRVDARTIRFYQTLGIVPKPEYEGRRAIYQREHLLRVISAKQLQSEGFTLAQIQAALPARSTDDLARALFELAHDARGDAPGDAPGVARDVERASIVERIARPLAASTASLSTASLSTLVAYELTAGVTVLIDPARVSNHAALINTLASVVTREITTHDHGREARAHNEHAERSSNTLRSDEPNTNHGGKQ